MFRYQLIFVTLIAATWTQECTLPGLCIGTSIAVTDGGEKHECVTLCKGTQGCEYYTYDTFDSFCSAYQTCAFRDESCTTCTTGEKECPPLLCNMIGGCVGVLEDEFSTFNSGAQVCSSGCQSDDRCNYYTYFEDAGHCLLYSTCSVSETECEGCVTSEKFCQPEDTGGSEPSDFLVVIKAYSMDEISVIDLGSERSCSSIDPGPLSSITQGQSIQGTFVGGNMLICGQETDQSYLYDDEGAVWSDGPPKQAFRFLPYGVDMSENLYWLAGGEEASVYLKTTEVYDGTSFVTSVDLPVETRDHCMAKISDTEAMLVTGYNLGNQAFIVNVETGESNEVISLPHSTEVLLAQCAKATKTNGDEVIVVAGGLYEDVDEVSTTTHIYDINLGVWLPGPELPESRAWGRAVQYQDSFVVVGGADSLSTSANFRTQIVQYDPDNEAWVVLAQTLENPDFVTAAMMAPADFVVNCS